MDSDAPGQATRQDHTRKSDPVEQWWAEARAKLQEDLALLATDQRSWHDTLARRLGRTPPDASPTPDATARPEYSAPPVTSPAAATYRRPGKPTILMPEPDQVERYLHESINGLAGRLPRESARKLLGRRRRSALLAFVAINALLLLVWPVNVLIFWIGVITAIYAATVIDRVILFARSLDGRAVDVISDETARALPDDELPTFTVLVPAYREPEVIQHLLRAVGGIEYPANKLRVTLLLEADDESTIAAATGIDDLSIPVDIVLVPPAEPRTKPKALNYGINMATSDIITVYDAEDVPDPLQLRRAAAIFARHGNELACIQSQLSFSNVQQNIITRWFALEYAMWFSLFLPGLVASGAPVPLGGTSNHIRRSALEEIGGWDPFNVTEDADLGIRLHRHGYRTRVMDSVTLEEANSDFVNWVKQRSRWFKGYLQTWIVHMREPGRLWRETGPKGFLRFNLFVGGTPALAALNPVFWLLTLLWYVDQPHLIKELFPAPIFYVGLLCWAVGNFTIAYLWVVSTRLTKRSDLLVAALLAPLYWAMMGVGVAKALVQLVLTPSYWEKTTHGLHHRHAPAATSS